MVDADHDTLIDEQLVVSNVIRLISLKDHIDKHILQIYDI